MNTYSSPQCRIPEFDHVSSVKPDQLASDAPSLLAPRVLLYLIMLRVIVSLFAHPPLPSIPRFYAVVVHDPISGPYLFRCSTVSCLSFRPQALFPFVLLCFPPVVWRTQHLSSFPWPAALHQPFLSCHHRTFVYIHNPFFQV